VIGAISSWAGGFLCITAIVALAAGFGPMRAAAAHLNATPPTVRFNWPPLAGLASSAPSTPGGEPRTWINAQIRSDLEHAALSKLGADPFDRRSLVAARDALAATGWFRDDLKLSRDTAGVVHISGTWRIPAAAVRFAGEDMLVSSTGELLPVKYRPDASGYKVIVGASHNPPELGNPWIGGDVQAGLKLLALASTLPCTRQIAAVDVSDYSPGRSLVLVTDLGNRILWGGPVDEFNPGQASPAAKLRRLADVYREQGRVDAGHPLLDIRLLDGVYVHDTANVMERTQQVNSDSARSGKPDGPKPKKSVSR
jgi:hypothetical protein